jgi:hypothetical protein
MKLLKMIDLAPDDEKRHEIILELNLSPFE